MKIVKQSVELLTPITQESLLKILELAGRVCYKSEHKISDNSAEKFVSNIIKNNHQSVLEHVSLTFRLITDRGVSHELVRHRMASYSQESTRYCRYKDEIQVIQPIGLRDDQRMMWEYYARLEEGNYLTLLKFGMTPEQARSVLPTCVKTEIIMTANLREWLHIIKLRTSASAHPQIRELIGLVQNELVERYPIIFGREVRDE